MTPIHNYGIEISHHNHQSALKSIATASRAASSSFPVLDFGFVLVELARQFIRFIGLLLTQTPDQSTSDRTKLNANNLRSFFCPR